MVFDFGKFTGEALKAVDRIRSLAADPRIVEGNPTEPIESRINAFYRAIGLPAVVSEGINLPLNNGNVHDISMTTDLKRNFVNRENAFNSPIDESIVNSFLDGENNLTIKDGIEFVSGQADVQVPKRTRGALLPMLVNGDVGIFPQSRRITGPFFSTKQVIVDNTRYERPTIELIVLLRLRGSGVQDDTLQQALNDEFAQSLGEGFVDTNGLNILTFEVIRGLLRTTLETKDVVRKTVQNLGKIRIRIRSVFEDQRANVPNEQPITKSSDLDGSLEKLKTQQQTEQNRKNSLFTLLEYDDTISNGEQVTRNMKEAWLAHSILDVLTTDSQGIEISLKETDMQSKKLEKLNKAQQRQMDSLLGTFSGLSGLDVLVVIVSLFTMEEQFLLGLLNEDAFQRLKIIKGQGFSPSRAGVDASVDQLKRKVTETYDRLADTIKIQELLESRQAQRGGA